MILEKISRGGSEGRTQVAPLRGERGQQERKNELICKSAKKKRQQEGLGTSIKS